MTACECGAKGGITVQHSPDGVKIGIQKRASGGLARGCGGTETVCWDHPGVYWFNIDSCSYFGGT